MRLPSSLSLPAAALLALSGCVAPSAPPPPAPVRPAPAPAPVPTPPPPPVSADWRDWPLTPGNWAYRQDPRGSTALYGQAGQEAELTLRCDADRRRLVLSRRGAAAPGLPGLTIRTTSTARTVAVAPGMAGYGAAELGARDALIDAIGFSRGRFVVEGGGQPTLVVPAWAEILRVAEDCRG